MKKLLITLVILAAAVGGAFATGDAPETEATDLVTSIGSPVSIEFWHGMSGPLGEVTDQIVADFNASVGADLGITVTSVYQGRYGDLKQKTSAAIKAGNAPVVAQGYADYVSEFMQADVVVPLDAYISDSEVGIEDFTDIFEGYRDENSQYPGGMFFSLPFNKSTEVFYYNADVFDQYGLSAPTTWEELEEVSQVLFEATGKPAFGYDSLSNYMITMIRQFGGEYTNSMGDILFGESDAVVKAIEMYKRNYDAGYWRIAGEDRYHSGPFNNGDVYMFIGSTAGSSFVGSDLFEWKSAPIPQLESGTGAVIQQGTNVMVMNQNKTPEEVYAGYEFVKYLTSNEANLYWATNTGYLPIRQSVVDSRAYQAFLVSTDDSTKLTGPAQSDYYFYDPGFFTPDRTSYDVRLQIGLILEDALLNGTPAEEAVQTGLASLQ